MTISIDSLLTRRGLLRQTLPQGDCVSASADGVPTSPSRLLHPAARPACGGDLPLAMEPLTASDLARRLGIDRTNAWRLIRRARREGTYPVTLGEPGPRGGRRPLLIWWPLPVEQGEAA